MKIFISHQRDDSVLAGTIALRLKNVHAIDYYLDVIDPNASQAGDALGDYVRAQLGTCTQLLAVVSPSTKTSWWVPWEIGISTEKDYPIATFAGQACDLPLYLKKWPYLRSDQDLDKYAQQSKATERYLNQRVLELKETVSKARVSATRDFHASLRKSLGQS